MRYTNRHFTYLLTYLLRHQQREMFRIHNTTNLQIIIISVKIVEGVFGFADSILLLRLLFHLCQQRQLTLV